MTSNGEKAAHCSASWAGGLTALRGPPLAGWPWIRPGAWENRRLELSDRSGPCSDRQLFMAPKEGHKPRAISVGHPSGRGLAGESRTIAVRWLQSCLGRATQPKGAQARSWQLPAQDVEKKERSCQTHLEGVAAGESGSAYALEKPSVPTETGQSLRILIPKSPTPALFSEPPPGPKTVKLPGSRKQGRQNGKVSQHSLADGICDYQRKSRKSRMDRMPFWYGSQLQPGVGKEGGAALGG